ncbi:Methyltetrahydroprotoberberine 14-monooxygenase [Arachis hypogaea]|nr:Methyltetrahydroprotoberberine 14-monooxygenase [Arachis hypogaea]
MAFNRAPPPSWWLTTTSREAKRNGQKVRTNFAIRLGIHKTLVVSSKEMAKECFTINDMAFASRPTGIAFQVLLGYNFSMIGFCRYSAYWRYVRKLATLGILSIHRTRY